MTLQSQSRCLIHVRARCDIPIVVYFIMEEDGNGTMSDSVVSDRAAVVRTSLMLC